MSKKVKSYIFALCLLTSSCYLFEKEDEGGEPYYKAKIAWDTGLVSNDYQSQMLDGDSVFFYERPPGYNTVNIYALTRLDVKTGSFIWRSNRIFSSALHCPPLAIGGYIYVFLYPNRILCFNRETGALTAQAQVWIDNKSLTWHDNVIEYQGNIYLGLRKGGVGYFIRFPADLIDKKGDPDTVQEIPPQVLWEPVTGGYAFAKPVVHNNIIYTSTMSWAANFYITNPADKKPVELAGFDADNGKMIFHRAFGGPEDIAANAIFPEEGDRKTPLFIHGDVLYYLGLSIAAWDLNTGEMLYRHIFPKGTPDHLLYGSETKQAVFYKGRIYFTSSEGSSLGDFSNLHCIDAATGELVWNVMPKGSESTQTNPIIANDKLYISLHYGFRVYEPENGKLLGVDKSFCGTGFGSNILYNDYMICIRVDSDGLNGRLVAVDLSK